MTDEKFPDKEVEVKLDPITDLIQTTIKTNDAMWMAGFDAGYEKGYWKGWKAGSLTSTEDIERSNTTRGPELNHD